MKPRVLIASVVMPVVLLSGCNGGDPPSTEPTEPSADTSTQPSGSASPTESPTGSTGSTGSAGSPSPSAATGTLVEGDFYSYRLPAEVEWDLGRDGHSATFYDDDLNAFDIGSFTVVLQAGQSESDLADDFQTMVDNAGSFDPPFERGEDREADGVMGWTAETTTTDGYLNYLFGARTAGHSIEFSFHMWAKDPRSRRWIDAVLASLQWK